jgi:hypothetical protein
MAGYDEDEVIKLGAAISRKEFRDSFRADLAGALSKHGIDKEKIPQELLDVLGSLSPEQFEVLANVKAALTKSGLSDRVKAEMV